MIRGRWAVVLAVLLCTTSFFGADSNAEAPKTKKARKEPPVSAELQALKEAVASQQKQIDQLRQQLQQRDQQIQQTQQQLNSVQTEASGAASKAQTAAASSEENARSVSAVRADVTDLKTASTNTAATIQAEQARIKDLENPATIHYKGITITPGGFIEAAGIFRTRNENASVNSASGDFNIPLEGTTNARMTEYRFDARQSRLSVLAEGKVGSTKATGYYEMDFLGAAPTANENQSNSFNMRQRQIWAQAAFNNGITFTGGQQWSLFTLNRRGEDNRAEFIPLTINAQYVIGYDWARQAALRVTKNFNNKAWFGFSVENPQTTLNANTVTAAGTFASFPITGGASAPQIFGFQTSTNATSPNGLLALSNTPGATGTSTNPAPDVVAKLAFEPGWGHFEIKGMGRFFRDRYFNGAAYQNDIVTGGGGGIGAILPVVKSKLDLIVEALAGDGMGRYGSGGGFDVTLKPTGAIEPVRTYHALVGPEIHATPKLDVYAYGGYEYYQRTTFLATTATPYVAAGTTVGYGSPLFNDTGCTREAPNSSSLVCSNQTRYAYEVTPGFWYRFYKGSAGTVQWGMQYSYSVRALWRANSALGPSLFVAPRGIENQVYSSFRYYFP